MVLQRLHGDDGANAVEFALVLPILIVLVIGILWGGVALNQKLTHTQAAREGARFGATLPFDGSLPGNDWFELVQDRIDQASTGSLTGTTGAYCIRFVDDDGNEEFRIYPDATTQTAVTLLGRYPACEVEDDTSPVADRARVEVVTGGRARLDFVFYDYSRHIFSDSVARFEPDIEP